MKNLFVYGDSYSSSELNPVRKSWATMFAERMEFNLINRAVGGCSTHYQFLKLIEDYNSFQENDVIIFGTGYPQRYHFLHQREEPESSGLHSASRWVQKNKKYIDWYLTNLDWEQCSYNQGMLPHVLRNIAEQRPDLTIILTQVLKPQFMFPLTLPENFLILDFQLHDVSVREFDGFDFPEWNEKVQIDLRCNHLSIPNVKILSEIVEETYRNRKVELGVENRFLKKVFASPFKNKKEVMQAVQNGLIYDPSHLDLKTFLAFFNCC